MKTEDTARTAQKGDRCVPKPEYLGEFGSFLVYSGRGLLAEYDQQYPELSRNDIVCCLARALGQLWIEDFGTSGWDQYLIRSLSLDLVFLVYISRTETERGRPVADLVRPMERYAFKQFVNDIERFAVEKPNHWAWFEVNPEWHFTYYVQSGRIFASFQEIDIA